MEPPLGRSDPDPEETYPRDLIIPVPESALDHFLTPEQSSDLRDHLRQVGVLNRYAMTWDSLKEFEGLKEMRQNVVRDERERPVRLGLWEAAFFLVVIFGIGMLFGAWSPI